MPSDSSTPQPTFPCLLISGSVAEPRGGGHSSVRTPDMSTTGALSGGSWDQLSGLPGLTLHSPPPACSLPNQMGRGTILLSSPASQSLSLALHAFLSELAIAPSRGKKKLQGQCGKEAARIRSPEKSLGKEEPPAGRRRLRAPDPAPAARTLDMPGTRGGAREPQRARTGR